jgi:hypothetical protein
MRSGSRWHWATTAALLTAAGMSSCMAPPDRLGYQIHAGPALPASEVSVVMLGDAAVARFDGLTAKRGDWTEVRLEPGLHRIEWIAHLPEDSDPQLDLAWLASSYRFVAVLESGHTYSLRTSADTGIVDETTARPARTQPLEVP